MKIQIILIAMLLLVVTVSAYECQDDMAYWNSPCEVVTPVISTSSCNASILNINNTDINYTIGITPIGDGTHNFTFNYTEIATYSITLDCNSYSGTINLNNGRGEDEPGFNLWFILIVLFFTLITIGAYKKSYVLIFISGGLSLLMGIYIFREGVTIYGVENWWVYPLAWIFIGLGIIISIVSSLKFMAENEGDHDNEEGGIL